jgi:DNA repair exonuclease SbcCD nuclease subunit
MAVCFVHTADWQIGKQFGTMPDEPRVVLARQRIDTVKTIARLARDHGADAILVAGDVFETGAVKDETIRRTLLAMAEFSGPWVLLPGNHDAALAESPWTRIPRLDQPANVLLATVPEPIGLLGGRLAILPAPLQRRQEGADLTGWFDSAAVGAGAIRVGLAHGSVQSFLPGDAEAPNPIAHDRAERAGLDYLALGDWHGTLRIGDRTWYAGTPEPDRFKANDQGNVVVVRIEAPGSPPQVERRRSARYRWSELSLSVHGESDVLDIGDAIHRLHPPLADAVVKLTLQGAIDLRTRLAVNRMLEELTAQVLHLGVDDSLLIAAPSDDDLDRIDTRGFVRTAIERLRDQANDPANGERDTARLALQLLYLEHRKQGG